MGDKSPANAKKQASQKQNAKTKASNNKVFSKKK